MPPFEVLQSSLAAVDWRLGFIRRLVVIGRGEDQAQNDGLRGILEHGSLRFLSTLDLSALWALAMAAGLRAPLSRLDPEALEQVVAALASTPRPPLRSLDLGDDPAKDLAPVPRAGPLVSKHTLKAFSAATPALRALTPTDERLVSRFEHLELKIGP